MLITGDGFNSTTGVETAERIYSKTRGIIDCVQDIISLCDKTLKKASISEQESANGKQKVIACVVLARLLETSEAIVLLARSGFGNEVNSLFRIFLEAYFIFGNVANNPGFVPEYFGSDKAIRKKLINVSSKYSEAPFIQVNEYATTEIKRTLDEAIEEAKSTEANTFNYATRIGCNVIYDSMYRVASATVHSTPRALTAYISEAPNGTILEIKRGPSLGDIPNRLYDIGCFLIKVYSGINEVLELEKSQEIKTLEDSLEALVIIADA